MPKAKPFIKHLSISFFILVILTSILFLSSGLIKNIVINPQNYFSRDFQLADIQFIFIFLALIIIVVLISYVTYLLLTSKTRVEMVLWLTTRLVAKSREQFVKLYEEAPVPYIMLSKKGVIKGPNKSALRFFGVLPEEIADKNFFSFFLEEDKEKAERLYQHYVSNIPINREEIRMITKNGATKSVLLSVFEMANPVDNTSTGLVMIFDITEQKRLDQAKTEFVSLASHQLRTPLSTTKWYTEMLISGDLGELLPKQKEYIDKLYTSNENMIGLVDVLLNVSKIEMGSLPVDLKETNVEELSESIFTELSSEIEKKKILIEKRYNGHLQNIKSDPKLLRIVIQNLISNAVKYTPDQGKVTLTFQESGGDKRIIVSDSGIGIPVNQQERIFTKLFRADNVRKLSNIQSTGLGLYMVKSIIESLGGNISFVSEENKGSIFTIIL